MDPRDAFLERARQGAGIVPVTREVVTDADTPVAALDRKSTRLNSSHLVISYAVFCLKKKKSSLRDHRRPQPPKYGATLRTPLPCADEMTPAPGRLTSAASASKYHSIVRRRNAGCCS